MEGVDGVCSLTKEVCGIRVGFLVGRINKPAWRSLSFGETSELRLEL